MADPGAVVPGGVIAPGGGAEAAAAALPAQQNWFSIVKNLLMRGALIYFVTSFFRNTMTNVNKTTNSTTTPGQISSAVPASNVYSKFTPMDMYMFIAEGENFTMFEDPLRLIWHESNLKFGDWQQGPQHDGTLYKTVTFPTPPTVKENGSIYLHVYFVRAGFSPNPRDAAATNKRRLHANHEENDEDFLPEQQHHSEASGGLYDEKTTVHAVRRLNKYQRKYYRNTANLLSGTSQIDKVEKAKAESGIKWEILNYWHPNLTINLIDDYSHWSPASLPATMMQYVKFDRLRRHYKPILYVNDYWNLRKDLQPINSTVETLTLNLQMYYLSLWKWQIYLSQGMQSQWATSMLGESMVEEQESDQDSIKEALIETNPYLLGVTVVFSIMHTICEFMAFKNDIQFWRTRSSLEGLSVRLVFFNVFQSLIVLLYVLDNDTNFMVKVSIFIGLAIELWKIFKVVDVAVNYERRWLGGLIPSISIKDKGSYVESETKVFDQMAFKYLGMLLFPMLAAYAVYSVIYQEHRGWYSWVLNMLYSFLLTFGFISMTPQLFINYKMRSVAHLPWRMMTYKFLNTFIDDIFAFVIKMPTLYRIGCLRDDVIFFIFLYQRWIYPVDKARVNEYGVSADMLEKSKRGLPVDAAAAPGETLALTENAAAAVENKTPSAVKKQTTKKSTTKQRKHVVFADEAAAAVDEGEKVENLTGEKIEEEENVLRRRNVNINDDDDVGSTSTSASSSSFEDLSDDNVVVEENKHKSE